MEQAESRLNVLGERTELAEGRIDELIKDLRETRHWRTRIETKVDKVSEKQDKQDESLFELLAIARGADQTAVEAKKKALSAKNVANAAKNKADVAEARGSWTNEVVQDVARSNIHVSEVNAVAAIEMKKKLYGKLIWAGGIFYVTVIPPLIAILVHGCGK